MHFTEKIIYPAVLCDGLTSIIGILSVSGIRLSNFGSFGLYEFIMLVIAISLSFFALALNYWTKRIWRGKGVEVILKVTWVFAIAIDAITTIFGVIAVFAWQNPLGEEYVSFQGNLQSLNTIQIAIAILFSIFIVISPMALNAIRGFSASVQT